MYVMKYFTLETKIYCFYLVHFLAQPNIFQCLTYSICLSAGGVGGHMPVCLPAGTGSWSGGGIGNRADYCRLQDSIVIKYDFELFVSSYEYRY